MELGNSIEGSAMIRVAIIPIGNVSPSVFVDYSSLIMHYRKLELSNISSFYKEAQKSPFFHQPWKTGSVQFKFVIENQPKSLWEDFQSHRKIHGVIGICHCPVSPNLGEAYSKFQEECKAFPLAQTKRCLAFDPEDSQVEQDDNSHSDLVLFPWADPQKLDFLMATIMQDFAASVLMAFELWVLHADPIGGTLSTPLDFQASLSSEEAKKRRLGRIQKAIGDYCMLAGSPQDAHEHYKSAIDLAKPSADNLWHAGALEGITSAIVMDTPYKTQELEDVVRERYNEVIQLYHRVPALVFELEARMKLAKFICKKENSKEVTQHLTAAVEAGKQLTLTSDKIILFTEVAQLFSELGYERKASFFALQVAQLAQQDESQSASCNALQILHLTTPAYRVASRTCNELPNDGKPDIPDAKARHRRKSSIFRLQFPLALSLSPVQKVNEWPNLQISVLGDLLSTAIRAGDALAAWTAAARLLRSYYPLIKPKGQYALAAALTACAERIAPGSRLADPSLPFIRIRDFPKSPINADAIKKLSNQKDWWSSSTGGGPFIYTPFTSKGTSDSEEVIWVVGEVAQVLVEVSNPCAFELSVESMSLSVSPPFEAFPVSFSIPPNTPSQSVVLAGIPLSSGPCTVRGCFVSTFGIVVEHLFDDFVNVSTDSFGPVINDPFRGWDGKAKYIPPTLLATVVKPLPLLVGRIGENEGMPVLFEGEIRDMDLKLTNVGTVPVWRAHLSLMGKQVGHVLSFDQDMLQKLLPIGPGCEVTVKVTVRAQLSGFEKGDAGSRRNIPWSDARESILASFVIQYTGVDEEEGTSLSRRLVVPLHIHVERGLFVVRAQLLAMCGPSKASAGGQVISTPKQDKRRTKPSLSSKDGEEEEMSLREGKGLRLLEVEVWNGTDVTFEVTARVRGVDTKNGRSGEECGGLSQEQVGEQSIRIDRECSARVLVPLEAFRAGVAGPPLPDPHSSHDKNKSSAERDVSRQFVLPRNTVDAKMAAQHEAAVDALCSQVSLHWHSARRSRGEISVRDAVRDALKGPAIEILLPDLVTFSFVLSPVPSSSNPNFIGFLAKAANFGKEISGTGGVVARELTHVSLTVHNNSDKQLSMALSVTCRDVVGVSCMGGGRGGTVMWSGCVNGVDISVPAWGEGSHEFTLCFLVPGEYTLLAAAVVENYEPGGLEAKILNSSTPKKICCSGLPYKVVVASNTSSGDVDLQLEE